MNLHLLRSATGITIHYDTFNDWLFVEWEGELTLPLVQLASLELAQCFLERPYARVLNSNLLVTSISWDVAPWLLTELLPYLHLAGIKHLAWVRPQTIRGQQLINTMLSRLPGLSISLFDDIDQAVTWLGRNRSPADTSCTVLKHSPATQAQLEELIHATVYRLQG
jgi:hypothetical protein